MPELFDVTWTEPQKLVSPVLTFYEACAVAVTQSARAKVTTQFHFGGYVYIVNAGKYDEDTYDA